MRAHTPNTQKICSETFHSLVQMQLTKRRKNSIFTFVIRLGGVAQLVERLNGIQEVRGSTPLISTTYKKTNPILSGSFTFSGALHGDTVPKGNVNSEYKRGLTIIQLVSRASDQRKSPMNTGLPAHRTFVFVTQNHPLTHLVTQILFVPERLWILFCFRLSITRKGQSLSFCGRRVRLP